MNKLKVRKIYSRKLKTIILSKNTSKSVRKHKRCKL
ncbi:hypothetical protein V1478_002195 [Vespula squamosa]|uniref:Uncharacterized protein n=1 Tax=Vespula squamosa TaxID=30214 RepID=A0ABD2BPU3_VESSQ